MMPRGIASTGGPHVHTTKVEIPFGFYDFTVPQNHRSSLYQWEEWFKSIGRETTVVRNTKNQFILCVRGKEVVNPELPPRKKVIILKRPALQGI